MHRVISPFLMILATAAAHAQSDIDDFRQIFEQFLAQQRVYLNCSAPDSQLHAIVVGQFEDMVKATSDLLRTHAKPADITDFEARTTLGAMLMREHKFGEVIDLCKSHPTWQDDVYQFRFIILQNEAGRIFYVRHLPADQGKP